MAYGSQDSTPRQVFYPSCAVNMELLFDEALSVTYDAKSLADLVKVNGPPVPPSFIADGKPLFDSKDQSNQLTKLIGVVPKTCQVNLNGIHQASTFEVTFPLRDFPIDPRVIRQMAVTVHLDSVDPGNFATGLAGPPGAGRTTSERRNSVLIPTEANSVIYGVVDNIDINSGDGGEYVHMSGRDLRGIFLDTPIVAELLHALDPTKPINEFVQQIVNFHPRGKQISVSTKISVTAADASFWPDGVIPAPLVPQEITRQSMDAQGSRPVNIAKGDPNTMNCWDLIIQNCVLCGAVPMFVGNQMKILPSFNILNAKLAEQLNVQGQRTPFAGNQPRNVTAPVVQKAESWNYRRVVYGRDVLNLKFERKLGGVKPMAVIATSIDPSKKGAAQIVQGSYPPDYKKQARTTSQGTGAQTPQVEEIRISIPGVKSKTRLENIAKSFREQLSRQEVGGSISTKNLTSFGGLPSDSDLLRLQPADPIEIRVDASGLGTFPPSISEYNQHEARSLEEEIQFVYSRVGDMNLAKVLVTTARGVLLQTQRTFRVSNVKYAWDVSSGIAIDFDFQNYVALRSDPDFNQGTTTGNQTASGAQ